MQSNQAPEAKTEKVGFLLGIGILLLPFIFSWFTLGKGYSTTARVVSFVWLLVFLGVAGDHRRATDGASPSPGSTSSSSMLRSTVDGGVSANAGPSAKLSADSNWTYSVSSDAMRGTKRRFASVTSENTLDFAFPYSGGSRGMLTLREQNGELNIMLGIEKGQFICHSFGSNVVSAKFDEGPIQRFGCTTPSDGTANLIFLTQEKTFLKNIRSARKLILEAEFFQEGRRQLIFNVARLSW